MQNGYFKRKEEETLKTATYLAAIKNTYSRKIGNVPFTPEDFLSGKESAQVSPEDQRALALQALENSKRFEKGVIYETLD